MVLQMPNLCMAAQPDALQHNDLAGMREVRLREEGFDIALSTLRQKLNMNH